MEEKFSVACAAAPKKPLSMIWRRWAEICAGKKFSLCGMSLIECSTSEWMDCKFSFVFMTLYGWMFFAAVEWKSFMSCDAMTQNSRFSVEIANGKFLRSRKVLSSPPPTLFLFFFQFFHLPPSQNILDNSSKFTQILFIIIVVAATQVKFEIWKKNVFLIATVQSSQQPALTPTRHRNKNVEILDKDFSLDFTRNYALECCVYFHHCWGNVIQLDGISSSFIKEATSTQHRAFLQFSWKYPNFKKFRRLPVGPSNLPLFRGADVVLPRKWKINWWGRWIKNFCMSSQIFPLVEI